MPRKLKIIGDAEEFSRDDKSQAGFIAPVGKGPAKGGKPHGVPYNFGKSSGTKGRGKSTKDSNFNPSVVNSESLVDTVIGVGESGTEKPNVGLNKSTSRAIHRRTRCKETFANGQTRQRKEKVTASPKAKVKVKARARENIQEKGITTRTRLDLRMKKLDSARWEFVGDV